MIEALETLLVLRESGTMYQAATRLRLTQPTVSKRIAALSSELGIPLVEPVGRLIRLTPEAELLLERTAPLLVELRQALSLPRTEQPPRRLTLGVSESILASWGPLALRKAAQKLPNLEIEIHAHRSPRVLDRVRNHELMLGLCAGVSETVSDLHAEKVREEALVLIPRTGNKPPRLHWDTQIDILTIEQASATWRSLEHRLRRLQKERGISIQVTRELESFSAVVQLARAGFGHGLAPIGIARALGCRREGVDHIPFPGGGLSRPISLVGKPRIFAQPWIRVLISELKAGN